MVVSFYFWMNCAQFSFLRTTFGNNLPVKSSGSGTFIFWVHERWSPQKMEFKQLLSIRWFSLAVSILLLKKSGKSCPPSSFFGLFLSRKNRA